MSKQKTVVIPENNGNEGKNAVNGLLGCYVSVSTNATFDKNTQEKAFEKGRLFRNYIWGENGINNILKKIIPNLYGNEINLILFEFHINPIKEQFEYIDKEFQLKKKEKAIGIPVIVTDDLFFNQSENKRMEYLENTVFEKLNHLSEYIKNKKMNLQTDLIINDLHKEWDAARAEFKTKMSNKLKNTEMSKEKTNNCMIKKV